MERKLCCQWTQTQFLLLISEGLRKYSCTSSLCPKGSGKVLFKTKEFLVWVPKNWSAVDHYPLTTSSGSWVKDMLLFSLVPCAEDYEQLWCYQFWNTFGNSVSQAHSLFNWKWKQIVCSSFNIPVVCKAWGWTCSCILLCSRSVMSESLWPHGLQHARLACPSPSSGASRLMSIESVMPSIHLVLCLPLLLLPSVFPRIRVFSNVSALCIRWPKFWSCSFSISPSSIRDWFPLVLTGLIFLKSKGILRDFS